jgi:polyphosphate kinase 2
MDVRAMTVEANSKRNRDSSAAPTRKRASRLAAEGEAPDAARGAREAPAGLPFPFNVKELPKDVADKAMASGGYPYDKKMKRKRYEKELRPLQIELLKLQTWIRDTGERLVIVFEGRDGAGKGGNIARFTQHLNPRSARVVALSKPSETEGGQWYFQRYAARLPSKGEIVFFDRSWYNRAGVERVMGFATEAEAERFLQEAPVFERLLVDEGIRLVKLFLTVGREMQLSRLHARYHDPLKRWKLSPIDFEGPAKWDAYSQAFDRMLRLTDRAPAPWTIVRANCKMRARLNSMRHVLTALPYAGHDDEAVGALDGKIVGTAADSLARGGED